MTNINYKEDIHFHTTRRAVIWTAIFNEPLQVLFFSFASVILYKSLHASAFQIAILNMLKPVVALLSLYWSALIQLRPKQLVSSIVITGILTRLPFIFIPLVEEPWLMIIGAGFYMMLTRGGIPAWMEVVKQNIPENERSKLFSLSTAFGYLEGIVLSVAIGFFLDNNPSAWKWLFPSTALIGMLSVIFQAQLKQKIEHKEKEARSVKDLVIAPWKESAQLLQANREFRFFQLGFMAAGFGMMIMQTALPFFVVDYLKLSYTELALALSVCKGLGFAFASSSWSSFLNRTNIFHTSAFVFFTVCLYPLFLIAAMAHPAFVDIAYICYGIGQAGSHLTWHLSGTIFAKDADSHPYSNVNVLTVGLRGIVAHPLGSLLFLACGPIGVFISSVLLCSIAGYAMLNKKSQQSAIAVS
jgi:F0F1-type ATP synthase assembly protein I